MSCNALKDISCSHAYDEWSSNTEAFSQRLRELTLTQLEIESQAIYAIHYSHDSMNSSERRAKIKMIRAISAEIESRSHTRVSPQIQEYVWGNREKVIHLIQSKK